MRRAKRDVERGVGARRFVATLRRLADCIEQGRRVRIQIAGERVAVPPGARLSLEHERGAREEEVEIQFRWQRGP